jgi:hypothetical protein
MKRNDYIHRLLLLSVFCCFQLSCYNFYKDIVIKIANKKLRVINQTEFVKRYAFKEQSCRFCNNKDSILQISCDDRDSAFTINDELITNIEARKKVKCLSKKDSLTIGSRFRSITFNYKNKDYLLIFEDKSSYIRGEYHFFYLNFQDKLGHTINRVIFDRTFFENINDVYIKENRIYILYRSTSPIPSHGEVGYLLLDDLINPIR